MTDDQNRKWRDDSPAPVAGWQIVYTGFILILLCFFVMLTSFASLEQSKITRFVQGFSTAVSVFSSGKSLEEGQTMINPGAMMVDKEDAMAELFRQVRMLGQQRELGQVDIQQSRRGIIMTLSDKLLFDSGQAGLAKKAYPLLDKIAGIVRDINTPVEIEGHTDDVPIHNRAYASNWDLSTARAVNVLRFITDGGRSRPEIGVCRRNGREPPGCSQ